MADVATLISSWQGADSALPRLTWYAPGGERVELSGRVLSNWVVKVANLLTEEADAEPGTEVLIDLPVHWRTLAWSLGAWLIGAQVRFGSRVAGDGEGSGGAGVTGPVGGAEAIAAESIAAEMTSADVIVTDRPEAAGQAEVLIAVALPALAMAFDGDLPPGAIDGAADLMTYPDQLVMPTEPVGLDEVSGPPWTGAGRVLLDAGGPAVVGRVLSIWRAGGSVVLVADPNADHDHLAGNEGAELLPLN